MSLPVLVARGMDALEEELTREWGDELARRVSSLLCQPERHGDRDELRVGHFASTVSTPHAA